MTYQNPIQPCDPKLPLALESSKTHQSKSTLVESHSLSSETDQLRTEETKVETSKEENHVDKNKESERLSVKTQRDNEETMSKQHVEAEGEDNGHERLKRHRREVAGRVWIPDIWGQEDRLKDWIDCSAFDACLVPGGISEARAALVDNGRRASSGGLSVENSQKLRPRSDNY